MRNAAINKCRGVHHQLHVDAGREGERKANSLPFHFTNSSNQFIRNSFSKNAKNHSVMDGECSRGGVRERSRKHRREQEWEREREEEKKAYMCYCARWKLLCVGTSRYWRFFFFLLDIVSLNRPEHTLSEYFWKYMVIKWVSCLEEHCRV